MASGSDAAIEAARQVANYARNAPYVLPGDHAYDTPLSLPQEKQFRSWVSKNNVPFDPNAGITDYDMRGFWKAQQSGDPSAAQAVDPNDNRIHYPDTFKTPYHETFSNQSQWATPNAPHWTDDDKLVDQSGGVLFDDRAARANGGRTKLASGGSPGMSDADIFGGASPSGGLSDAAIFGSKGGLSDSDITGTSEDTGFTGALTAGLKQAYSGPASTVSALATGKPGADEEPKIKAAEPVAWSDLLAPKTLAEKLTYQLASSAPTLAGGIAGGAAGALVGDGAGGLVGAPIGAALAGVASSLGPNLANALKETNGDSEAAWSLAKERTAIEGGATGIGWWLFGKAPFEGVVKNALFQAFGVQPGVSLGASAAQNVAEGRPATEGLAAQYPNAVAGTLIPAIGVPLAERAAARSAETTPATAPATPGPVREQPTPTAEAPTPDRTVTQTPEGDWAVQFNGGEMGAGRFRTPREAEAALPTEQRSAGEPVTAPTLTEAADTAVREAIEAEAAAPPAEVRPEAPAETSQAAQDAVDEAGIPAPGADISRIAELEATRNAEGRAERLPGDPSQSFAAIEANGNPEDWEEFNRPLHAPTAPAPPVDTTGSTALPYTMFAPSDLKTDPALQYKRAGDRGVTGALEGQARWEPLLSSPLTVLQRLNGDNYVVNGHQRLDLAQRAEAQGQEGIQLPAHVLREADGIDVPTARVIGALQNIAEGSGTAVDAARILKNREAIPEEMQHIYQALPPRSALVKNAEGLSRLDDRALGMVDNGIVPEAYAAEVGRQITDPTEQVAALGQLAQAAPDNIDQARTMIKDMRAQGFFRGEQTTLFGDEAFAKSLIKERAKILDSALRQVSGAKRTLKAAVEGEDTLTSVGNVMSHEANVQAKTESERVYETIRREATNRGPISDALSAAARDLAGGKPIRGVAAKFLAEAKRLALAGETGAGAGEAAGPLEEPGLGLPEPYAPKIIKREPGGRPIERSPMPEGGADRIVDAIRNKLNAPGGTGGGAEFLDAIGRADDLDAGATTTLEGRPAEAPAAATPIGHANFDAVSDAVAAVTGGNGPSTSEQPSSIPARRVAQSKALNAVERFSIFPRTLAALDDLSARLWNAWHARDEAGNQNIERLRSMVPTLTSLDSASRDRVYAALELARKYDWTPADDGSQIRVRNDNYWQAQHSKVGDNYLLNPAETKATHEALALGREQWSTIMDALAKREGWTGPVSSQAVAEAASDPMRPASERRQLNRLSGALYAAEQQRAKPYFPAMRHGDYYIAVRPKVGEDPESLGGFPEVKWFETVERPQTDDPLGVSRATPAESPEAQAAAQRIRDMKLPDGSPAFPEGTHDIQIGDLTHKADILRQVNIPAIEKVFALNQNSSVQSIVAKMQEEQIPEGASPREMAAAKARIAQYDGTGRLVGGEALDRYKQYQGDVKEAVIDALYDELRAGWKRQAKLTPGYDPNFDRAIGNHLYQVGRNAADMIHRDAVDRAYEAIQDSHPEKSVKGYWKDWRDYQDRGSDPLSRGAASLNQVGAVFAMGMNPSTTLAIAAHSPMMAAPTLSVGAGMGEASKQMVRGLREAYSAATLGKDGFGLDLTKTGRTPSEKALIKDAADRGFLHANGAQDVAQINDRQASLFGRSSGVMKRAMEIAMSNISLVDQANRVGTLMAAYRMAQKPDVLARMAAPLMEKNAAFRDMAQTQGLTPENFAKFMLSQAAGEWGKMNRAPIARGPMGLLLMSLHGFQTRYLSNALALAKNTGPAGRVAAAWMMGGLAMGAGVAGLPFTTDMENAADKLWQFFTKRNPMMATRIQADLAQLMGNGQWGKIGAEMVMRGPMSEALGVDLPSRIGFGDVLSRDIPWTNPSDSLGAAPSILWGRLAAAKERLESGQGAGAAAGELLPTAIRNPIRAYEQSQNGVRSISSGKPVPGLAKPSGTDIAKQALGVTPQDYERAYQRREYGFDVNSRNHPMTPVPENPVP